MNTAMSLAPIDIYYIRNNLKTRFMGTKIIYQYSASSTMDIALDGVSSNALHGTVAIADTQQQGKGRLTHEWVSPPGGVYLSIIIYPPDRFIPLLTMTACLAAIDCIEEITAIRPEIKWPNDIHINGKKVCGILAVRGVSATNKNYVIVGIGINVIGDLNYYPGIKEIAANLAQITGKTISREAVICSFLEKFEKRYYSLESNEQLWKEFKANLNTIGKRIAVKIGNKRYKGIAESVNSEGCLLLRQDNKELIIIPAGDVTLQAQK